ncbi:thaumatin-like protein [Seminavis robusta]|uniref:Thaumatin-like protein n=1 Tax=Seminavis robusta TaxID=568900 RepID=A0A9N8EVI3_9STRA|nr:thaumatin-like protein [Seminavis robusta]|eukprot:Sro2361_g324840.1 thaumatin-like protein (348) ;mRNA; r:14442-15485
MPTPAPTEDTRALTLPPIGGGAPAPTTPPTDPPTELPTWLPTAHPTTPPSNPPTNLPTRSPTNRPTLPPTEVPTDPPTGSPSGSPSSSPSSSPSKSPTEPPTNPPTETPTNPPTAPPTEKPTSWPTIPPTRKPTPWPTVMPATVPPTASPTAQTPSRPPRVPKKKVITNGIVSNEAYVPFCRGDASTNSFTLDGTISFTFEPAYDSAMPSEAMDLHEANIALESFRFLERELGRIYDFQTLTGEAVSSQTVHTLCAACNLYENTFDLDFRAVLTFNDCVEPSQVLHTLTSPGLKFKSLLYPVNQWVSPQGGHHWTHSPFAEVQVLHDGQVCSVQCNQGKRKRRKRKH